MPKWLAARAARISPFAQFRPRSPIGASATGMVTGRPSRVVAVERRSTSMPTRWRSPIASMSALLARSVHSVYAPQSTYSKIARATRFLASSRRSSMQVTTGMAPHFTMRNGDAAGGSEESDPGDRAHDEAAQRPVAASGAARAEADRAVHGAASVDRAPDPLLDVGRSHRRSRRARELSPRHAAARARKPGEIPHQRARARAAADARAALADGRDRESFGAPRRRDRLRRAQLVGPLGDARRARDRRSGIAARHGGGKIVSARGWLCPAARLRQAHRPRHAHEKYDHQSRAARARPRAHPAP